MKSIKITRLVTFALANLALLSNSVYAEQSCDGETETTPSDRFDIGTTDTYLNDSLTGLIWAKCVVGQTWNTTSQTCVGEPLRLTWQQALQQAATFRVNNNTDWRLPNLKELASIVEHKCVSPSINISMFPASPVGGFWTSTPNTSADLSMEAWSIAFDNGRIDSSDKFSDFYVRMVRYAE
ncbi:DUF1566 domain-containing protein [Psychrosphaera sp. B3R10]|uniref:Lcl C-terminal domain-containing protein n=1 Tax=unclassified Psychrosphaera TaxID=2641570 RepID=UPI001C09EFE6|nr:MULTISPECIES: DUF1566 domain-containing protein [unclassified Psychrosphaera]MBU2882104.1 DUF1566 domain-containing protein [Psychrosphaera sp. I2R16]MBU2990192.1 DUF1566 domain-containing protein [Psychrosphaera sp. B3R10]